MTQGSDDGKVPQEDIETTDEKNLDPKQAQAILTVGDSEDGAARGKDGRGAANGGGTMSGGVKDDAEGGTTAATSMTGGAVDGRPDRDTP
jgi:hypothetical protein